jgi:putative ABC transport system permease protein
VDTKARPVERPTDGVVLSAKLAELLDVEAGDPVRVEVLVGKKQEFVVPVERTVEEYVGLSGYADLEALSRRIDEEEVLNGALLLIDADREEELTRILKNLPAVTGVVFTRQSRRIFEETFAAFMGIMLGVMAMFAGIISFGVIYNASRITLAERERSLASMQILGFTVKEVTRVLSRENLFLTVISLPPGLLVGSSFCWALVHLYDTDLFRFPMALSGATLVKTSLGILLFTVLANLAVRRRVRRLDIVEALKARE